MSDKRTVFKLPSGKVMKYTISNFENGENLYRTFLEEVGGVDLDAKTELDEKLFVKVVLKSLSSKKIKEAIWECFDQASIEGEGKLTKEYFEPAEHREDYVPILVEIAKANLYPFGKSLFAQFLPLFQEVTKNSQA